MIKVLYPSYYKAQNRNYTSSEKSSWSKHKLGFRSKSDSTKHPDHVTLTVLEPKPMLHPILKNRNYTPSTPVKDVKKLTIKEHIRLRISCAANQTKQKYTQTVNSCKTHWALWYRKGKGCIISGDNRYCYYYSRSGKRWLSNNLRKSRKVPETFKNITVSFKEKVRIHTKSYDFSSESDSDLELDSDFESDLIKFTITDDIQIVDLSPQDSTYDDLKSSMNPWRWAWHLTKSKYSELKMFDKVKKDKIRHEMLTERPEITILKEDMKYDNEKVVIVKKDNVMTVGCEECKLAALCKWLKKKKDTHTSNNKQKKLSCDEMLRISRAIR
ncbi:hypothetical protein WICPIJ_006496 [Wickerhamomyces pijperi]|uniref:Uncharacterized protein n=1 Tax=Wickerhamomyces pijperi TaxID=599730 RepID=A0A9P8TLC2_WICPI|nr:hypothetical protein WICPIJ_006496 [Wickerhamomyces pijperi]